MDELGTQSNLGGNGLASHNGSLHLRPALNSWGAIELFVSLSRTSLIFSFLALLALRFVIGFHFFSEGTEKVREKDFTSEYFLRAAVGPFASYYHGMVDDFDGRSRLCASIDEDESGEQRLVLDPLISEQIWKDFVEHAKSHYEFGGKDIVASLQLRRDDLKEQIERARSEKDSAVNIAGLESERRAYAETIKHVRNQVVFADDLLQSAIDEMKQLLRENEVEILGHFKGESRLEGFARDGIDRKKVAQSVDTLRGQIGSIARERTKASAPWLQQAEEIWDGLEREINGLAVDKQREKGFFLLHRPHSPPGSRMKLIDRMIPWFDIVIGALLLLGLFSRFASLAGAAFLASVILSQPPWVPGASETIYQTIEMFALLVICATAAGRYGGLDFFVHRFWKNAFRRSPAVES